MHAGSPRFHPQLCIKQSRVTPAFGDGGRRIRCSKSSSATLKASLGYRRPQKRKRRGRREVRRKGKGS